MKISIIIPTCNEHDTIGQLLPYLYENSSTVNLAEVIVADGGSTDNTLNKVQQSGARAIQTNQPCRAIQMNAAARQASGEILYFLHADTFPPSGFDQLIIDACKQQFAAGSFRLAFDWDHWFLNAFAWFTRFNVSAVRFGDQSLFVQKPTFNAVNGFNEKLAIMEDQEIVHRLKKQGSFTVLQAKVITSARKYRANGVFYQQAVYALVYVLYYLGVDQTALRRLL